MTDLSSENNDNMYVLNHDNINRESDTENHLNENNQNDFNVSTNTKTIPGIKNSARTSDGPPL